MRHWLLALCLLGSLSARAQSPVWALHGAHNTVYLAESVHLLKPADATLPAAFTRAYDDSSQLVMEIAQYVGFGHGFGFCCCSCFFQPSSLAFNAAASASAIMPLC